MTSMTHPCIEIQTSPLAVAALPHWFGEVSLVAQYLTHLGVLEALSQRVRLARGRMGTYEVIDFVAVLLGYALSGERTLQTFYERILPFACPFMALFGRKLLPHRSSLSRFLASLDQSTVEALRTLFLEDLVARELGGGEQRGLWDRCGKPWHVFDVDGTRAVARQRALPRSPDLPVPRRRLEEVCAPGYRGHKRGEVVRTRTVVQEASTHRLLGTFSGAGNGDYRGELSRALGTVRTYLAEQPLAPSRVIVRLDGLYGDGVVVGDVDQQRLGWLTRGRDYGLLDRPPVQARLALPAQQQHTQLDSGLTRQLFDCPQVVLTAQGTRSRVVIATHVATTASPPVGVLRAGLVYELFYTSLPPEAFLPSDVLDLYFGRGGFESSLADEDQEQDADRWCSGTPWGQEGWQIVAQWVWNLRLELSQRTWPSELRTTQLAEAVTPETSAAVEASPRLPEVHALEASAPQLVGQWARAARPGLFAGHDFTPQANGTLRCPAGQSLWERERRPQADGSLRIYYAARRGSCRACALRAQCLGGEPTQVLGRKVSVVVGRTPAPARPPAAALGAPVVVGTQPLLWRDWERRAGRRAWMGWLRSQQVTITRLPSPPPAQSRGSPTLSRAQRAHRRLSWQERLSRNAARAQSPQVRIRLCGIPAALAQMVGLAS
jgi:hypothetical protein